MRARLQHFFSTESASGIVMLASAALALIFANGFAPHYAALTHFTVRGIDLHMLTSDILMPIFFLAVGLELKLEMQEGMLAQTSQRILPLVAALGGIAMPALLYLAITRSESMLASGWAIPTATDIAFAVGVLSLAGSRVPAAAKIFLLAIAIYDDLAAIVIIAVFYSGGLALAPLAAAAATTIAMLTLNRYYASTPLILISGAILGALLFHGGIHPTVAGMVTGLCIPRHQLAALQHRLHPCVAFGILPLFAFASAGISLADFSIASLLAPLPMGVAFALFVGKPLGIGLATLATVRLGAARMPEGMTPPMLWAIGIIAGIGFTMSLFITQLAFYDHGLREAATIGIVIGSALSACTGLFLLKR